MFTKITLNEQFQYDFVLEVLHFRFIYVSYVFELKLYNMKHIKINNNLFSDIYYYNNTFEMQ